MAFDFGSDNAVVKENPIESKAKDVTSRLFFCWKFHLCSESETLSISPSDLKFDQDNGSGLELRTEGLTISNTVLAARPAESDGSRTPCCVAVWCWEQKNNLNRVDDMRREV